MTADDSAEALTHHEQTSEHESLEQQIRLRAHEISLSEEAGTPEDNWARAEHELNGQG